MDFGRSCSEEIDSGGSSKPSDESCNIQDRMKEPGEESSESEQEEKVELRVDHCLICAEAAVYFHVDGSIIKREPISQVYVSHDLISTIYKCFIGRNNCKEGVNYDWDFSTEQFPICEKCEMQLVSLTEVYSKLDQLETQLRNVVTSSEVKYLSEGLYEKHDERYWLFRTEIFHKTSSVIMRQPQYGEQETVANFQTSSSRKSISSKPKAIGNSRESAAKYNPTETPERKRTKSPPTCPGLARSVRTAEDQPEISNCEHKRTSFTDNILSQERTLRKCPKPVYFSASSSSGDVLDTALDTVDMADRVYSYSPTFESISSEPRSSSDEGGTLKKNPRMKKKAKFVRKGTKKRRKATTEKKNDDPFEVSIDNENLDTEPGKVFTLWFTKCRVCSKPIPKGAVEEYKQHLWTHLSEEEKQAALSSRGSKRGLGKSSVPITLPSKRPSEPYPEDLVESGQVTPCDTCGKLVYTISMLTHQKTHLPPEEKKSFLCSLCGVAVSSRRNLERHRKNVHPDGRVVNGPHRCLFPQCSAYFSIEEELHSHVTEAHPKQNRRKSMCTLCGKILSTSSALKTHSLTHSQIMKFTCPHCPKKFRWRDSLNRHLASQHGIIIKLFKCVQLGCGVEFPTKWHYGEHLRKIHGVFVGRNGQNMNAQEKASGRGKKRPAKPKEKHEESTVSEEESSFICPFCGISRGSRRMISIHIKHQHPTDTEEKHKCLFPQCSENFQSESDLKAHVELQHVPNYHPGEGEKESQKMLCTQCGRILSNSWAFKIHQRIHSKENNYACKFCPNRYSLKSTLDVHHAAKHGFGTKRFKCEECGKEFPCRTYYKQHMRFKHRVFVKKTTKNT